MHNFRLKELVTFTGQAGTSSAAGTYEVVRLIPVDHVGEPQYRIKSLKENYERMARESQLAKS